jgi:hypothetical protein
MENEGASGTVEGWMDSVLVYAARDPFSFLYYVLLLLSPLFLLSAVLSWKLSKDIEKKEKKRKRRQKKSD